MTATAGISAPDPPYERRVVCRVSTHTLRLEREFQLSKVSTKHLQMSCAPACAVAYTPNQGHS